MSLLQSLKNLTPREFRAHWRSPSNIAFIKYWGKKGHQLPANSSLSMTLKECYTDTIVHFQPSEDLKVDLFLDGVKEVRFALKIRNYLETLQSELPWLKGMELKVETRNTFPHGTGIASSASGLSAFALCLTEYLYACAGEARDELFIKRASHLSRLASGSACRSVYGGFATWGECHLPESSDEYATPFLAHPDLYQLQDSVLVVSGDEKSVSSRAGHERMKEHAFAAARFLEAKGNFSKLIPAMKSLDFDTIGLILENEALQLHAMMMTSPAAFMLMRPNTLAAIEMIRDFRLQTKLPLYFTLDAGPNLHLIYPETYKSKITTFINHELSPLCVQIIHDQVGEGPSSCL